MIDRDLILSVCMITYNHEKYIKQSIESILIQKTSFPLEIVVGEDCSTDKTADIIKKYATQYPNIIKARYNKYNLGAISNVIVTTERCTGKYISFLEGDDFWTDPYKLQKQVAYLEENEKCAGCFHETQLINEENGQYGKVYGINAPDKIYPVDTISISSPFHTSSFVFRRSALEYPEWMSTVVSADMALFSIMSKTGYLKKIPGIMSVYRKTESGISSRKEIVDSFHQKRIELANLLNLYHDYKYSEKVNEVIEYHKKHIKKSSPTIARYFKSVIKKFLNKINV